MVYNFELRVSQGSAATRLNMVGIDFVANFMENTTVKKF